MKTFRRNLAIVLLVIMAATATVGLGVASARSDSSGVVGSDRTHLDAVTIAFGGDKELLVYLPVLLAEKLGFFADEGLDVSLHSYLGGQEAKQALLAGEADLVAGFYSNVVLGAARGEELVSFFTLMRYPGWAVVAGPQAADVTSISELAGKTIGISSLNSGTHVFARYVLQLADVPPDTVTFREVGTGAGAVAALADGDVDVAVLYEPSATEAITAVPGAWVIVDTSFGEAVQLVFGTDTVPGSSLFTTAQWLEERPDVARRVAAAVARALDWIHFNTISVMEIRYEDETGESAGGPGGVEPSDGRVTVEVDHRMRMFSQDGLMTPTGARATLALLAAAYDDLAIDAADLNATYTNEFLPAAGARSTAADVIFQVSVINALMEGVFDGVMSLAELGRYGDFGLGTVHAVDGELVVADGEFYKVRDDGVAYNVTGRDSTPFAAVTFFNPEYGFSIDGRLSQPEMEEFLLRSMVSINAPYAIRIDGSFAYVKVRSVAQQEPPYPRLEDVVREQAEFEYENIRGTMVGFWTPYYFEGVNVPGFHFHFVSEDRQRGGHVLAFETDAVEVALDKKDQVIVDLPVDHPDFRALDFGRQSLEELERIESQ